MKAKLVKQQFITSKITWKRISNMGDYNKIAINHTAAFIWFKEYNKLGTNRTSCLPRRYARFRVMNFSCKFALQTNVCCQGTTTDLIPRHKQKSVAISNCERKRLTILPHSLMKLDILPLFQPCLRTII